MYRFIPLKKEQSAIQQPEVKVLLSSNTEGRPISNRTEWSRRAACNREWRDKRVGVGGGLSVVTILLREQRGFVRFKQHAIRVLTVAQRFSSTDLTHLPKHDSKQAEPDIAVCCLSVCHCVVVHVMYFFFFRGGGGRGGYLSNCKSCLICSRNFLALQLLINLEIDANVR